MADKYRVAIASTDGESVNTHYGKSEIFYIYIVDDDEGYDLLEKRKVTPVCQEGFHNKAAMETHVQQKTAAVCRPEIRVVFVCPGEVVLKMDWRKPLEERLDGRRSGFEDRARRKCGGGLACGGDRLVEDELRLVFREP